MGIAEMIDATARCTKCDATIRAGCDCWVRLKCPKCGRKRMTERDDSDPPATVEVRTLCPECCGGDFSEVLYFDRHGEQILEF